MDLDNQQWRDWARLMERVQEGDTEAYAKLLSEISPLIFNYVRKRVFNPSHVEDVYQDVLLRFHKARHTYQSSRPLGPWLFAVVRNAVWTSLGKKRKHSEREVFFEEFPDFPAEIAHEDGLDDRLQTALQALTPESRQAVEMLKIKGMDVESAARELGISKIALKVRAHRGYARLRKLLAEKQETNR